MFHCMKDLQHTMKNVSQKITKEQKCTMSLFLYKVSLNYIKIYLEHIMN